MVPTAFRRLVVALMLTFVATLLATPDARAQSKPAPAPAGKVDINTASQAELEQLPGVGPATAKKIIAGRPFSSVADLAKAGVPARTIEKITPLVTVSGAAAPAAAPSAAPAPQAAAKSKASPAAKVDLNTASQAELEQLPGVGPATAKKIVAGRPFASVADLAKAGVPAHTIEKITPLVTVSGAAPTAAPSAAPAPQAAPTPKPAAPAAPAPQTAPAPKATAPPSAAAPAQPPPAKGMVWVNTATGVYHKEGDRYYGNTKQGKYMTEEEAIKAGYRAAKTSEKKK